MNIDVNAVTQAYADCALWCSNIEANDLDMSDDTSMQSAGYTIDDIAPAVIAGMRDDVADFLAGTLQFALAFWEYEHGAAAIGHDFWLTRNGHGAGFWDRWSGNTPGAMFGRILSDAARPYGSYDLYVGDDGLIYGS